MLEYPNVMPSTLFLEYPWVLAAWPVIIALLVLISWRIGRIFTRTVIAALVVRSVLVLLILLVVAGPHVFQRAKTTTTVFLMDASRSLTPSDWAKERAFVTRAIDTKPKLDKVSVVLFGRDSTVQLRSTALTDSVKDYPLNVDRDATNIQEALQTAESILPGDTAKRVVILSDGNENVGSAELEADSLRSQGVQVDYVPVSKPDPKSVQPEILVDRIGTPATASVNQPVPIRVTVRSNTGQTAQLALRRDGVPIQTTVVNVKPGTSSTVISDKNQSGGLHRYDVALDPQSDTEPGNNVGHAFVEVHGAPRVLCLTDHPGLQNKALGQSLRAHGIDFEEHLPSEIPAMAVALANFDCVLVSNIQSTEIPTSLQQVLEAQVRTSGLGLGMIGGLDSFGAGGYSDTPIESALPVFMSERVKKRRQPLALVLVIEDLEEPVLVNMSIEAAKAVVGTLMPGDTIGVIDCNRGIWRIPPQSAVNKKLLQDKVEDLHDMGDPAQYDPYLDKAAKYLQSVNGYQKHMIFFGDGDAEMPSATLLSSIKSSGITLSTITTGADAEGIKETQYMARLGGGTNYIVEGDTDMPSTAVRDQKMYQRQRYVELPTSVSADSGSPLLLGLNANSAPYLLGYDIAEAKPNALTDMIGGSEHDPILAHWQYGLGRSFAFTSEANGGWGAPWLNWSGYSQLWSQTLRWTIRDRAARNIQLAAALSHGAGHLRADISEVGGQPPSNVQAYVTLTTGAAQPVTLTKTRNGVYEGSFAADQIGDYFITASANWGTGKSQTSEVKQSTLVVPYSDEYKNLDPNIDLLQELADLTDGASLDSPESVYKTNPNRLTSIVDPTIALIIVSMFIFLIDVAIRKLGFEYIVGLFKRRPPREPETTRILQPRQKLRQPRGQVAATSGVSTSRQTTRAVRTAQTTTPQTTAESDELADPLAQPRRSASVGSDALDQLKHRSVGEIDDPFPSARKARKPRSGD